VFSSQIGLLSHWNPYAVLSLEAFACCLYCNTWSGHSGIEAYLSGRLASFSVLTLLVGLSCLCSLVKLCCSVIQVATIWADINFIWCIFHALFCLFCVDRCRLVQAVRPAARLMISRPNCHCSIDTGDWLRCITLWAIHRSAHKKRGTLHLTISLASLNWFLGGIECMKCWLLLPMFVLTVTWLKSAEARAVYAMCHVRGVIRCSLCQIPLASCCKFSPEEMVHVTDVKLTTSRQQCMHLTS